MSGITYQRPAHPHYTRFCAAIRYEGGSTITACGDRWETASTPVLIGVDVGKLECPACVAVLSEPLTGRERFAAFAAAPEFPCSVLATSDVLGPVEAGLRELAHAPAIVTQPLHTSSEPGVLREGEMAWDLSDEESA